MRNHWIDDPPSEDEEFGTSRGRNPDSSVAPQYEDSVPPEVEEGHEPS